ncbi:MAG: phage holin family protein [Burkholderia sp.]|nr:phage holin family protein [Burkholderia sp.]
MTIDHTSMQSDIQILNSLFKTIVKLFRARFQLISIEIAEEKKRLIFIISLGLIIVLSAIMALISLTALVEIIFWNTYRIQALAVLCALYTLISVACIIKIWINLRDSPNMFQSTLNEFEKDCELFYTKT